MHLNVLVFPGGSEIGLEIWKALSPCKEVTLFSAAMATPNHASCVYERHFEIPSIHEEGWLEALNRVIDDNDIDYLYPAYDDVIVAVSERSEEIHARLVLPSAGTCRLTRSKSLTYARFDGLLPVPERYPQPVPERCFPVFVKPDRGQGSQGAVLVNDAAQLACVLAQDESAIVMEYLPGEEVTVDCFSDRAGGLLFCGPRKRVRTKAGISMASRPFREPGFEQYAAVISKELALCGAWFFQMKQDCNGRFKLLEIAPRIAGAMALHRAMGVNFPLLSLYEQERMPVKIMVNSGDIELERALVNRYRHSYRYSALYIDLDDTLVLNGRVNLDVIRLIYQSINRGAPVKLLTRHAGDLGETLRRHRLDGLFDAVLHIGRHENKADYVAEADAVLVDDSFSERTRVHAARGVRTFDSSMLEALFDDRH